LDVDNKLIKRSKGLLGHDIIKIFFGDLSAVG
jgi:hypothetical protein